MPNFETSISTRELFCIEQLPEPAAIIVFGASGDLASRKLFPALFGLYRRGLLDRSFYIVGCGRQSMTDDEFRRRIDDSLSTIAADIAPQHRAEFVSRCTYIAGDYSDAATYSSLADHLADRDRHYSAVGNRLFYLSLPTSIHPAVIAHLKSSHLLDESADAKPFRRVVIEKPFGSDLASARRLHADLEQHLAERQIYRIDHYLGKDTVQNIFIFRFANAIFEPLWNQRYIDHVEIAVAESVGIEHRAGYFESSGLLRDMFQNHMLAMLSLVAMEPPVRFSADPFRDEMAKVLRSIRPLPIRSLNDWLVRGQYTSGNIAGCDVPAYRDETGVSPQSTTETFIAARLMIDNWRWRSVPFYLRSGKRLERKLSRIIIHFKPVPHSIFEPLTEDNFTPNTLVLNVQPEEGMSLTIQTKRPGPKLCMSDLTMSFRYRDAFGTEPPDAYERLLLDAMLGDQTLFIRFDALETAWQLWTPILDAWNEPAHNVPLHTYAAGSFGPDAADRLPTIDQRRWSDLHA